MMCDQFWLAVQFPQKVSDQVRAGWENFILPVNTDSDHLLTTTDVSEHICRHLVFNHGKSEL